MLQGEYHNLYRPAILNVAAYPKVSECVKSHNLHVFKAHNKLFVGAKLIKSYDMALYTHLHLQTKKMSSA